jgi:hypothetical protein
LRAQVFPRLLAAQPPYAFESCCFKMAKAKDGTARVVVYRELGIRYSYTLEASFCGPDFGPGAFTHFTSQLLETVGHQLCDGILDLFDPDQSKVSAAMRVIELAAAEDEEAKAAEKALRSQQHSGRKSARSRWIGAVRAVRRRSGKDLRPVKSAPSVGDGQQTQRRRRSVTAGAFTPSR